MIPGLSGMNPKKMQAMMKQLGINQEEVEADKVIIEKKEGGKVIIKNPRVQRIIMQGQESFQISGEVSEETEEVEISEEDIKLVMEKTGKKEGEVKRVLGETKDIAETILRLSQ